MIRTSLFLVSFFALTSVIACYGQNEIELLNGQTIQADELDAFLNEQMEDLNIPGLSIAVVNDAEIVYHRVLGVKNAQTEEPLDENTTFEAASMTKSVFAYFVMKMVDEGVLDLDQPLYEYLPNYDLDHDDRYRKITARLILTHQTGLPNWRYENKGQYLNLRFDPGTSFSYSGEGYEYLGNVIAHLKGQTRKQLQELIDTYVFKPFGMERAYFRWNEYLEKNKANGHNGGVANGRYQPLLPSMAGGLQTEAESFARFIIGLIEGEGLSRKSTEEMLKTQVKLPADHPFVSNFDTPEWALGFGVDPTDYGRVLSHGGNNGDFQSYFEFQKERRFGYVFLTNSDRGDRLNARLKPLMRTGSATRSELEETYEVLDRRISAYEDGDRSGIELNAFPSDGFAWIRGEAFSGGVIEFDVQGENRPGASFVGIAFHGQENGAYEGIYFRPFNFAANDEAGRSHMVQYHSLPNHSWRTLRGEHPGVYEAEILSAPGPDDWFHVRIEVDGRMIDVFVDDSPDPVLSVESLSGLATGKIGFWVGSNSSGRFANLKVREK